MITDEAIARIEQRFFDRASELLGADPVCNGRVTIGTLKQLREEVGNICRTVRRACESEEDS